MQKSSLLLALAALSSAALLSGCGDKQSKMNTSTPTATLGTDSAQVQAGGPPVAAPAGGAADTASHR